MKILETDRLILRTWKDSDLEPMSRINQDRLVMEYFPDRQDQATTKQFIKKINEHYDKRGYTFYAVDLKKNNIFIGFVGMLTTNFEAFFTPATEIGWRLCSKHWGKGYATEAAKAILHYAFTKLNLTEIVSFTVPTNKRSIRVIEKIGLLHNPTDSFEHPKLAPTSHLRKHVLYRLTRDEYLKNNLPNHNPK